MKIDLIAGARPNFVKIAAIIHAIEEGENQIEYRFIHTGQHYDENLSGSFFRELELPIPNLNLQTGSGSQAEQTASIMMAYEKALEKNKPDYCLVVGDVTSSMACAITAKKMKVKIIHIEAGLRSYDWEMPEEVNRVLIDSICDIFFTTSQRASNNLYRMGIAPEKVHFEGNVMIDTLLKFRPQFRKPAIWKELQLKEKEYLILTLHRPVNVDQTGKLLNILEDIQRFSKELPIIFPVHPRTAKMMGHLTLKEMNIYLIPPLSYLEFNYLVERSKAVITDSGGITEEATVLNIPCMTLRENTERPETVESGTNELIGTDPKEIESAMEKLFINNWKKGGIPERWDGSSAKRIISIINQLSF